MNVEDLRAFVAVVDAGSISQAARELYLTQPAVTRRVQRLEEAIGAPLIDRRRRPFALTAIGHAAAEHCRRLLATTDELKALSQSGALAGRECRIGVAHALTELALREPIDDLARAFPRLQVRLATGWSRDLLTRVRMGALDGAVVLLPDGERGPVGVACRALASEQLQVIAPLGWKTRLRELDDLAAQGWILNPGGCAAREGLRQRLARARLPLTVAVETYTYELQMSLVAGGRGLGLVPGRLLAHSPSRAKLAVVRLRGLAFPFTIWLATGEVGDGLAQPLTALGDTLRARLGRRRRRNAGPAGDVRKQ